MPATVAIVGRPNVGKSRLFNRLSRRRISIVHDEPGVTRDLISADVDGYTLMDTGGFGLVPGDTPERIVRAVDDQVLIALEMADVIVFVIDGQQGIASIDANIAEKLRQGGRPVVLVVNKIDHEKHEAIVSEAFSLGLGDPLAVSAEHGVGEMELREAIQKFLPEDDAAKGETDTDGERRLRICFVGRPNVGKSSIINCVCKAQRQIVSDVPGTTRESVDLDFDFPSRKDGLWPFTLTDTAGLKKGTKLGSSIEYFSQVRSLGAIRRSDVVFVVLDAVDGVGAQDKAIAGEAVSANKPVVIVVNKWDLAMKAFEEGRLAGYEKEVHYRKTFSEKVEREIFFTHGSPVVFTSALTGYSIQAMLRAAREVDARLDQTLSTGQLNRMLARITEKHPPPKVDGKRFRVYYAVQVGSRPYRIKMFCNQEYRLGDQYRRYLESNLIEEFGLQGCPILFTLIGKNPRGS